NLYNALIWQLAREVIAHIFHTYIEFGYNLFKGILNEKKTVTLCMYSDIYFVTNRLFSSKELGLKGFGLYENG
ncbi:MAG TPA: hypothetical protein QF423_01480, partial [Candidatus Scalindua sp.]|nr:hypothetical protein [Candidatus Scalindua sp.]